jgi:hypothetical protein
MALVQHVSILTHHALAAATPNKMKAGKPLEFYALLAIPPAAAADLQQIAEQSANGAPLGNFEIGIKRNGEQPKPIAGIPADWFVVRAATQYAPFVADAAGNQLLQTDAAQAAAIRSTFYAGKKVRVVLSSFPWEFKGKRGISFNLGGVMDAGEQSDRLVIGGADTSVFQKYANPNAAPAAVPGANAATVATPAAGNPFAQSVPAAANPFATQS